MLVLASCNSGGDSSDVTATTTTVAADTSDTDDAATTTTTTTVEETTTTTTTVEETTTTTAMAEETTTTIGDTSGETGDEVDLGDLTDQELAQVALVTIDDFPEGWTQFPAVDPDGDAADDITFDTEMADSLGISLDDFRQYAYDDTTADSDQFSAADGTASVDQSVKMAPDEAGAIGAMEQIGGDEVPACYQAGVNKIFTEDFLADPANEGITIGEITVVRVPTEEQFPADEVVMLQVEIPFEFDGQPASQFLTVMYQRQGRALSQLQFGSFGQPFALDGISQLGEATEQRLAIVG
jgi:hypothetical protein